MACFNLNTDCCLLSTRYVERTVHLQVKKCSDVILVGDHRTLLMEVGRHKRLQAKVTDDVIPIRSWDERGDDNMGRGTEKKQCSKKHVKLDQKAGSQARAGPYGTKGSMLGPQTCYHRGQDNRGNKGSKETIQMLETKDPWSDSQQDKSSQIFFKWSVTVAEAAWGKNYI